MKRSILYEVNGVIGRGRLRMRRNQVVEKYIRVCGLNKADAQDGEMEKTGVGTH